MTRQKQAILALAQEVMALYDKQLKPPTVPTAETPGQAQATRKLTVCEAWCCRKTVPSLRLQGHWLERAGFSAGTRVVVQVQEGKIVLLGCRNGEQPEDGSGH